MDYGEFKRQLGKAGLSAKEFAELVKMNPNSVTNYARNGGIPAHWAIVAALMGEMAEHGLNFRVVFEKIEILPKKVRGTKMFGQLGDRTSKHDGSTHSKVRDNK